MSEGAIERLTLEELRTTFDGDILTENDAGYEEARSIFNSAIETRPLIIACCASADDVRAALGYART